MMISSKKFLVLFLGILFSAASIACEDEYCGGWDGLYSTGGYNLYSFGVDIYSYVDYSSTYTSDYGGGCGTFTSNCNSCYDTASLYGGASTYNPNTQLINQLLISQINNSSMQMCATLGICGSNTTPGMIPGMNPMMPGMNGLPSMQPMPPSYTQYPPSLNPGFNPNAPLYPWPPITPPPGPLFPYGGCDNIVVMCPQPPPIRPDLPGTPIIPVGNPTTTPFYPGTPVIPTNNPGGNPTYQPQTQTLPQVPVRYRAPRNAVRSTH